MTMPHEQQARSAANPLFGLAITGRQRSALQLPASLLAFMALDVAAFAIAARFALAFAGATADVQPLRVNLFILLAVVWLMWFHVVKQIHRRRKPFWTELLKMLQALVALALIDAALIGALRLDLSQSWWAPVWVLLLVLLPVGRWVARALLSTAGLWHKPTVIIGNGENALQAYRALRSEPAMGFEVVAFACPRGPDTLGAMVDAAVSEDEAFVTPLSPVQGLPCVPWPTRATDRVELRQFHYVIALEAGQWPQRDAVIRQLTQCGVDDLQVIPAMRGVPLYGQETANFFSHEVLLIEVSNNLARPLSRWAKRVFDVIAASALIALTAPVMAFVAWRIWREDGAPFIFSQRRVGRGGVEFDFFKFRSMVNGAEDLLMQWKASNSPEWQRYVADNFKLANDPRVLQVGRFIRRSSLDELPQLFNVLRGDMSLVGPRPLLSRELVDYGPDIALYQLATPGLTGLWQISGRSGTRFADRVGFDVWYVKNWSLWIDIVILLKTVTVVFNKEGAY